MIGWFGKLPALGDFASRRLPEQFLQVWDDWLCIEITRAREVLGPDWDRAYAAAPSWRFALMPQVIDPNTWYGLLTPSTDRVGRQFPLTFAASSAGTPPLSVSWWIDLMDVASRATQPTCDADALESLLAEVEARAALQPAPVAAEAPTLLQPLAGLSTIWWRWETAAACFGGPLRFKALPSGADFLRLIAFTPDGSSTAAAAS